MGLAQNLARERAKHFGSEEAQDPAKATPTHRGHLIPTLSSSVVVTTTADEALADGVLTSPEEEKEFETKPRGFFADQFEVSRPRISPTDDKDDVLMGAVESKQLLRPPGRDRPRDLAAD